jgi:hypothetical protein
MEVSGYEVMSVTLWTGVPVFARPNTAHMAAGPSASSCTRWIDNLSFLAVAVMGRIPEPAALNWDDIIYFV